MVSFSCQSTHSSPIGYRCAGDVAGFVVFVCSSVDIFKIWRRWRQQFNTVQFHQRILTKRRYVIIFSVSFCRGNPFSVFFKGTRSVLIPLVSTAFVSHLMLSELVYKVTCPNSHARNFGHQCIFFGCGFREILTLATALVTFYSLLIC